MTSSEYDRHVTRLRPRLLSLAKKYSRTHDDAEDAAQEALIYTWEVIQRGEEIRSMWAFLSTVVKFKCMRQRIKEANRQQLAPTLQLGEFIEDIGADGKGLSEEGVGYANDFINQSRGTQELYPGWVPDYREAAIALPYHTSVSPLIPVSATTLLGKVKEVMDREGVTDQQRRRWMMNVYDGKSLNKVAEQEGVAHYAVQKQALRVKAILMRCRDEFAAL